MPRTTMLINTALDVPVIHERACEQRCSSNGCVRVWWKWSIFMPYLYDRSACLLAVWSEQIDGWHTVLFYERCSGTSWTVNQACLPATQLIELSGSEWRKKKKKNQCKCRVLLSSPNTHRVFVCNYRITDVLLFFVGLLYRLVRQNQKDNSTK